MTLASENPICVIFGEYTQTITPCLVLLCGVRYGQHIIPVVLGLN